MRGNLRHFMRPDQVIELAAGQVGSHVDADGSRRVACRVPPQSDLSETGEIRSYLAVAISQTHAAATLGVHDLAERFRPRASWSPSSFAT
ncbi:hypothetical protein LJR090_004359 [Bosea sp. LjRoot90]|uniref:hypothetical protein n=1 Tax=Bosea sp. LjRoot90 TaxID=3342342 RepID=UPI003ECF9DB5